MDRFLRDGATVVAVDLVQYPVEGTNVDSQICNLGDSGSIAEFARYLAEK